MTAWWIAGIGAWLGCGAVVPILDLCNGEGNITVLDAIGTLVFLICGPVLTLIYGFSECGWGDAVLWKRKEKL